MREWISQHKKLLIKLAILAVMVGIALYVNEGVGIALARILLIGF